MLAVLVAAGGAGVAGGIALARGDSGKAPGHAAILARGKFKTLTWGTTGTAILERNSSGKLFLRFDRAFSTRNAPDMYVYLDQQDLRTHKGNRGKNLLVGGLASPQGGQHYALPARAASMTNYIVEVYCAECDKTNALAQLRPAAQS